MSVGTGAFHHGVCPTSFDSEIAGTLSQISMKNKLMLTFKGSVASFFARSITLVSYDCVGYLE